MKGTAPYSTGKVDTNKVYTSGRFMLGPDYTFLKYKADAHNLKLSDLSVFSAGGSNESIGAALQVHPRLILHALNA